VGVCLEVAEEGGGGHCHTSAGYEFERACGGRGGARGRRLVAAGPSPHTGMCRAVLALVEGQQEHMQISHPPKSWTSVEASTLSMMSMSRLNLFKIRPARV